jgi:chemotaxis protein MotB
LPNNVTLEGHTDSKPYVGEYSNWELSTDRANSARKLMENHGLRPEQVQQVRGYADRQLRHPENPESPSNRRISVIVQYLNPKDAPTKEEPPGGAEGKEALGETPRKK